MLSKDIILRHLKEKIFYLIVVLISIFTLIYLISQKRYLEDKEWELRRDLKKYSKFLRDNRNIKKKEKELIEAVKNLEVNSLKGETGAIALTKLQNILIKKANNFNIDVDIIRGLKTKKIIKGWYVIAVRLNFSGDSKSFINFLYSIESSEKPYIFVDELDISVFSIYKKGSKTAKLRGYIVAKSFWFNPSSN